LASFPQRQNPQKVDDQRLCNQESSAMTFLFLEIAAFGVAYGWWRTQYNLFF
jgi:hypothetical protein